MLRARAEIMSLNGQRKASLSAKSDHIFSLKAMLLASRCCEVNRATSTTINKAETSRNSLKNHLWVECCQFYFINQANIVLMGKKKAQTVMQAVL